MAHPPEHAEPRTRSALNLRYSGHAPIYLLAVLAVPGLFAWNLLGSGVLWEQALGVAFLVVQVAVVVAAVRYLLLEDRRRSRGSVFTLPRGVRTDA